MFITALIFIAILSLLVFIHELGHFTVARMIGVKVEEFGFGLPPRIWGKKFGKHGTIYSINWLPIGGFVKLAGEDEAEGEGVKAKGVDKKEYFWARTKKERGAILLAGVTMNFLLAVAITTFLLTQGVMEPTGQVHVERVLSGSPAEAAGLQKGDVINSIVCSMCTVLEQNVSTPKDLIDYAKANAGTKLTLNVVRDGKPQVVIITPRVEYPKGEGPMGVAISDLETHVYPITEAPIAALRINVERAWQMVAGIGGLLGRIIKFEPVGKDIAGPIGIAQVTGEAVKFGWKAVLEFMSILSLNLAVLNVLPIPALDGGRFAFVVFEKLLGRKVKPAFEQSTHQIGMIVLFILILLISINDIIRLARGG